MSKIVLILHGWPQPISRSHIIYKYFENRGYKVVNPYLFSSKFVLNEEGIEGEVSGILGKNNPDVIVGISLGGLVAPNLSEKYPGSKLILVATGPYLNPSSYYFRNLVKFAYKHKRSIKLLKIIRFLPLSLVATIYRSLNPFYGNSHYEKTYLKDMLINIKNIKRIPIPEEQEIIDFATRVNNIKLLKRLKNKTIIFCGEKDALMPANLSEELHKFLKRSELVKVYGGHFNVITPESLKEFDKFLK